MEDPSDDDARGMMLLAASYAGVGFGNAGTHLPHGMSYSVSGMVREFRVPGYPTAHAMVPHGISVILNAPTAFRFTGAASPARHVAIAEALGAEIRGVPPEDAGESLADAITDFMRRLGVPNGLAALGYTQAHIPRLVAATLPQHRVTKLSPQPFTEKDLARIFRDALTAW